MIFTWKIKKKKRDYEVRLYMKVYIQ